MTSNFIWKASSPNSSSKKIRWFAGSNWALEDHGNTSKSYIYSEQTTLDLNDLPQCIVLTVKYMPDNWVGSELLEQAEIPYLKVKEDTYGLLEQIGDWMRFTPKCASNKNRMEEEFKRIQRWMQNPTTEKKVSKTINIKDVKKNFENFLLKYSVPLSG